MPGILLLLIASQLVLLCTCSGQHDTGHGGAPITVAPGAGGHGDAHDGGHGDAHGGGHGDAHGGGHGDAHGGGHGDAHGDAHGGGGHGGGHHGPPHPGYSGSAMLGVNVIIMTAVFLLAYMV